MNYCQKSHGSVSYPLVNVSDFQSSSYPSAESGYPWPDRSPNAWNKIPSPRQDSSPRRHEQYYAYPVSSEAGNASYDQRFSLSSVCPESAILQRESRIPFAPCSVGQHFPQLFSHQYSPSHLQGTYRSDCDYQKVSDTPCPFSEYSALAAASSSTRADCAFQFDPSLSSARAMHVYVNQGPLNSSGNTGGSTDRMIEHSVRNNNECSFRDQSTHGAWLYSGSQHNEIPQFGDSFELNRGY